MAVAFSQGWLDRYRALAADLPACPGATAVVQHTVTKAPDGDVTYVVTYEDGRVADVALGPVPAPDLAFTEAYPDAVRRAHDELPLVVGFMQGRVKLVGDTGRFLALQPVLQGEPHRAVVAALAAETD